ncbi:hypothetical protein [Escherichia coli]|uniref:hypothetical protein n=1 Tax=Escherichia coli TaxID=562 RepID=UPI001CA6DB44|nr:hypothetical protein [Escherichia coli]QZY67694.1 hypothetical protein K7X33_16500 [Escherichia coli]
MGSKMKDFIKYNVDAVFVMVFGVIVSVGIYSSWNEVSDFIFYGVILLAALIAVIASLLETVCLNLTGE